MSRQFTAAFRAFGCRLNQSETEALAASFADAGFSVLNGGQEADVFVFSTCTVTGKAEQKARRELRAAARACPNALILVSGCYAEVDPDALEALSPRILVIPGSRKSAIGTMAVPLLDALEHRLDTVQEARALAHAALGRVIDPFAFKPGDFSYRSRAGLKVQDGCDNRCAYCRVCIARGPSRSLQPAVALERAQALEASGFPEIVLTGVNLSQYRSDAMDFSALLDFLLAGTSRAAFRISSYEPDRVDDAFLRVFSHKRVRPHLHLAAQSGSDAVLSAMLRGYGRRAIIDAAHGARSAKADPFIGMDLIAGFPGEDEAAFSDTMDMLQQTQPAGLHAFPFSPRPGTAAFTMSPRVPERIAGQRVAAMSQLAAGFRAEFAHRRLGCVLDVVLERQDSSPDDEAESSVPAMAVSAEYLNVLISNVPAGAGPALRCTAVSAPAVHGGPDIVADADCP
ncbi:MAG TPA: tRNA (N(6)-L-threonylcarbamoyladenosine(37)-C(2))-methylthiotransferase MtaB [Spirochaetales bacterium]|nr:tRNA (N(6)-L-threonylcarbamoyladenosine(37)-C(2))-methylthiotransferase MtaB [Spirochaetales bacterium]